MSGARGRGRGGAGNRRSVGSGARGAAAGRGGGAGKGGARRTPPPTRIRPGSRAATAVPSGRRGQVRSTKERRGVGGDQVEGRQAVRELLLAGRRRVQEIWIAGDTEPAPILDDIRELAAAARVQVREVSRGKFAAQARCEAPQGVLALAAPLEEASLDDLLAGGTVQGRKVPPFLVALDGVTDPGNLGAVLRSAECAGATGVVLPRHRAVHVTPAATKAAAGAVEHLPIALVGGIPSALQQMAKAGVVTIGLDGAADRSLDQIGPAAEGPVCLVLGAEGRGLSRLVRERCDEVVAIPLRGHLASLNVAAAGTLACYEIARHR
ncbi:MAG TPA: 23S rRNA (guanosine(2251)-2'-O)-methyltransferase RlmB [Acidimicrobiales bacterium]